MRTLSGERARPAHQGGRAADGHTGREMAREGLTIMAIEHVAVRPGLALAYPGPRPGSGPAAGLCPALDRAWLAVAPGVTAVLPLGVFLIGAQGLAPTGQRVSVGAFEGWRLRDGRCAEHWLQLDLLDLLQQRGAARSAAPAVQRGAAAWEG